APHFGDQRLGSTRLAQVRGDGRDGDLVLLADLLGELVEPRGAARGQDQVVALGGERQREMCAQPCRGACDECSSAYHVASPMRLAFSLVRFLAGAESQENDMPDGSYRIPGPDHPITIEPSTARILVRVDGDVIADTTHSLTLREASYPP